MHGASHRFMLAVAASLLGAPLLGCDARVPPGPNIVLVVLDTLRPDHLGAYGYPRPTSPELDRLAEECVVFEDAQATAPWTAASLMSIMTSRLPDAHGVQSFPIPEVLPQDVPHLAESLQARGYTTAAFTEGGYAKPGFGLERGFDSYPANPGDATGYDSNLRSPSRLSKNVARGVSWLAERGDAPFFLFFHTYEAHVPLRPPEEFIQRFRPGYDEASEHDVLRLAIRDWEQTGRIDESDAFSIRSHAVHDPDSRISRVAGLPELLRAHPRLGRKLHLGSRGAEYTQWFVDLYDAEVAYMDQQLAPLWVAVAETQSRSPTILVIVSDHGEALGDHGQLKHGWGLHQEVLRVALMMCGPPDLLPPSRVPELVSTLDLMPTILDLLGVSLEGYRLQGTSLLPLSARSAAARPAFSQSLAVPGQERRHHSVRHGPWRLITDTTRGTTELYDRSKDPTEQHDVAHVHPDVVNELQGLITSRIVDSRELARPEPGRPADAEDLREELRALGYLDDAGQPEDLAP